VDGTVIVSAYPVNTVDESLKHKTFKTATS